MKSVNARPFGDPENAARKLVELAKAIKTIQDGRIYTDEINGPFMRQLKGTPSECAAGLNFAIAKGWLDLHESGTFVRLTQSGMALAA